MKALVKLYVRPETAAAIARHTAEVKDIVDKQIAGGIPGINDVTFLVVETVINTAEAVFEFGTFSTHSFNQRTRNALAESWKQIVELIKDDVLISPRAEYWTTSGAEM